MKHLIKCLALILILMSVYIPAQPQEQDEPVKDDSRSVELPGKQIIKDIRVGRLRRSVLTRSGPGIQDKLAVTLDIADDTREAPVPNFLLQPLVENAVQHGISKDKNDNKILVRSQKKDNRLCLLIQDNGPGIPQLETGDFINIKGGFGLKDTLERLKIQYEADYKFKLENSPEGGLIIYIEMPYATTKIYLLTCFT